MKRKTLLIIGIILISGIVVGASALSQSPDNEMVTDSGEHECPIEMMENMEPDNEQESKTNNSMEDCEPGMMESGNCDMDNPTMQECGSMMGTDMMSDPEHCDDMDAMMEEHKITPETKSF
jgi:hypothetical protein